MSSRMYITAGDWRPALDRELAHYRRYREDFSVVLLDLDHFKQLNDAMGTLPVTLH